jgi:STE24 endopeptidase
VRAMCRRYRVRVQGPLLWRTHGSMINGAILGIVWPFRYMLLTDALLERLTAEQVEGVMAHEIAHIRRRHLIWLGVCVLSSVLVISWVLNALTGTLQAVHLSPAWMSLMMSVTGLVGAGVIFGVVSRRFEWQADAFAVQHLSRTLPVDPPADLISAPAVKVMCSALQAVAELNGIDPEQFTWRHGSVRERQRRLGKLVRTSLEALPIDRQVLWIKVAAVVGMVGSILPFVIDYLSRGPHL